MRKCMAGDGLVCHGERQASTQPASAVVVATDAMRVLAG